MRFVTTPGVIAALIPAMLFSQQNPVPMPQDQPMRVGTLKLLVLEGDRATNDLSARTAVPPVIEVRDHNDRPVEGATVVFRGPVDGPGIFFPGQQTSRSVRTNAQGQAMATGMTSNRQLGKFSIHITAAIGNQTGETVITQTNASSVEAIKERKASRKWLWWTIAAGVAAGAVVGGVLATSGGASTPPAQPTVILNPGPITIGGPR